MQIGLKLSAFILRFVIFCGGFLIAPQVFAQELKAFTSDGCSLFPDSNRITNQQWCDCCFAHDVAYWQGGTRRERKLADVALRDCVFEKTGDELLANLMYEGVRFGGSPYFYNWYRWGYGWPFERKYQALTSNETEQVNKLLEAYLLNPQGAICKVASE